MELNIATPEGAKGTVAVSEVTSDVSSTKIWYTRQLSPIWLALVRVPRRRRIVLMFPVAVKSPGAKGYWPRACRYYP